MATKTKAQIETELKTAIAERDSAVKGLKDFKAKVPTVMKEKIEEYSLDLCPEGIADFCETLGVDAPKTLKEASGTIYISGFSLEGQNDRYGNVEFDSSDFESALHSAIKDVIHDNCEDYGYIDINIELESN